MAFDVMVPLKEALAQVATTASAGGGADRRVESVRIWEVGGVVPHVEN